MTDNQRIEILLSALNFRSARAFAGALGVNPQIFYDIKAGKCGISRDLSRAILEKYSSINPEWLLYGDGEPFKNSSPSINQTNINGDNNYVIGNNTTRPNMPAVIEVKENAVEVACPSCGVVIEVPNSAVLPLVPPEVARKPDVDLENFRQNCPQEMEEVDLRQVWGKGVFLMKVDTRAMEPEYREGTFLVLRKLKDLSYARPDGSAYVIDTMRPHTLFRYLSKERDGSYVLSAENDKRGPLYLNAEDIKHIYDIVGSFRIGR